VCFFVLGIKAIRANFADTSLQPQLSADIPKWQAPQAMCREPSLETEKRPDAASANAGRLREAAKHQLVDDVFVIPFHNGKWENLPPAGPASERPSRKNFD
jgi:hypothetical protein